MANPRPHLFLLNPSGEKKKFDSSRSFTPPTINAQKSPASYQHQKKTLKNSLQSLFARRQDRIANKTLNVPVNIEIIYLHFFVVFNNNDAFQNKRRFKKDFGLEPIVYRNFNQSVFFAITDEEKFINFVELLSLFTDSGDDVTPSGKEYSIITIIKDFEFISRDTILRTTNEDDILLSLIDSRESIQNSFESILSTLNAYLEDKRQNKLIETYTSTSAGEKTIQIKGVSQNIAQEIADNFDIVYKIQSIRVPTVRPNEYNIPEITWGIKITAPPDKNVQIGILDNGVRSIAPLQNIILDYKLDITNPIPNPLAATSPHGTAVASLAALGLDYFNTEKKDFVADAYIVPIKILNFSQGSFNPNDIETAIKEAYKKGVKIFNLSVSGPAKNYNSSISEYAYLLDRLTFKYDILIFIATGNLDIQDIEAMQAENPAGLHKYPNHFYNPFKTSASHNCECSNLCIPGESMNNITIGATADNLNGAVDSHLTPFKELPAYYTRKHYIDYSQKVNGTFFSDSQKNIHINKPDIVMPGGDVMNSYTGLQVFGFGTRGDDFYYYDSGTSLATPLATNIAAKILRQYPSLNMQSVKALMLNSSTQLLGDDFLTDVIDEIKEEKANEIYNRNFALLSPSEKDKINSNLKAKLLYTRLVGAGQPEATKALFSSDKSVTLVIQDSIFGDSYKVTNINIPEYLKNYSKSTYILTLKATLSYKFSPVFNNHLGYNPLHISFNFTKSVEKDNPARTAEIISDRRDGFYDQFYSDNSNNKEKIIARARSLGIKTKIQPWSEDFYPKSNKPFSNVQTLQLNIDKNEISKAGNQISLVVRCTYKTDLDRSLVEWLKTTPHEFSIAVTISEKDNDEFQQIDFYNELCNCNDLEQITTLDVDNEHELEVEADL